MEEIHIVIFFSTHFKLFLIIDKFHDFIEKKSSTDIVSETVDETTVTSKKIDTQIKKIRHELRHSFSTHYVVETYRYRVYGWWWSYSYTFTRRRPVTRRISYTVPITTYDTNTQNTRTSKTVTTQGPITNTTTQNNKHMVVSSMRLERYYSSVREETSFLMNDAVALLDAQDYIGFFKACGPNYVRGIRRAQEVTGIFTFTAENVEKAVKYAQTLKDGRKKKDTKHKTSETSLEIKIIGYGLGLNVVGAGSLVATNLEEYYEAMKFAFRSMTQSKDSYHVGQVYGIEVVPWVDNTAFQVAARLLDEVIETALPRSLIPKAICISDPVVEFNNSEGNRLEFRCKDASYQIDKYGQCCEENALYNHTTSAYDNFPPISTKVCRPVRALDRSIVKNNLIANGEFVARLDRTLRLKMNQLATMQQCISSARALPDRNNYNMVKAVDSTERHDITEPEFSLLELKLALDPFNDYQMITHLAKEIDEFTEMFYRPCMAALFGTNIGSSPDTKPEFIMSASWHSHPECTHMSCFGVGMRWDRKDGGCTPGMIAGGDAKAYESGDDEKAQCSKNADLGGDTEECRYNSTVLATFHGKAVKCWGVLPAGQINYVLDNYCMPELLPQKISANAQIALAVGQADECGTSFHPHRKTDPFEIYNTDSKFALSSASGDCVSNSVIHDRRRTVNPAAHFEFHLEDKTISNVGCTAFVWSMPAACRTGYVSGNELRLRAKEVASNPNYRQEWNDGR